MGIHKYLSFLIRRPSSASNVPKGTKLLLFKCCYTFRPLRSLSRLVLGNELKSRSPDSSTIIIITMRRSISLGVSPQMILKPISKVINNRRNNAKNYCYYTRSKISLCACCFFPRFVSILRQRAAAASKRQSSIILFI